MEAMISDVLKSKCDAQNLAKLTALNNDAVLQFVSQYVELCNLASVFVRTDSAEDISYVSLSGLVSKLLHLGYEGHTNEFFFCHSIPSTCHLFPLRRCKSHETQVQEAYQPLTHTPPVSDSRIGFAKRASTSPSEDGTRGT